MSPGQYTIVKGLGVVRAHSRTPAKAPGPPGALLVELWGDGLESTMSSSETSSPLHSSLSTATATHMGSRLAIPRSSWELPRNCRDLPGVARIRWEFRVLATPFVAPNSPLGAKWGCPQTPRSPNLDIAFERAPGPTLPLKPLRESKFAYFSSLAIKSGNWPSALFGV